MRLVKQNFYPCEGIQDSLGLWIPQSGFRIPGTHFQFLSVELGFWIPIVSAIPDSLSCIPDSNSWISDYISKIFLDSGVHRHLTLGEKLRLENLRKVWCLYVFWFILVFLEFYPWLNILFYYIDMSVLMENIPLVKFIKTTSGTEWFIFHNLTSEFIDDAISVISLQNL